MKKTTEKIKKIINNKPLAAFVITVFMLSVLYITRSVFPAGDREYMRMDFYHQYAPFAKDFRRRLLSGDGLLFSWKNGLGVNYWAQFCYYLASPTCFLYIFIPEEYIVEAMNFFMVVKGGLAAASMTFYLGKKGSPKQFYRVAFGVAYALCAYYMAYNGNIMWLDCFWALPLLMLGIEKIAHGKKGFLYGGILLFCTLSNYYIAIIAGFCCICYFIYCVINERKQSFKKVMAAIGRFGFYTILSCMVAGVVLLPTYLALKETNAGFSTFPKEWEMYYPLYELYTRMCLNAIPVVNDSELPNIFSSVLVLTLLPLYFCNGKIRTKKKISAGILVLFLLFGFSFNFPDYFWHGLHFPNAFPARQAFFYSFFVITLGYECFRKRKGIPKPAIIISGIVQIAASVLLWIFTGEDLETGGLSIFLCTIVIIAAYSYFLLYEGHIKKKLFKILVISMCLAEVFANCLVTGIRSTVSRPGYIEDDEIFREMTEDMEYEEQEFFRMEEYANKRTINDASWDNYNGASYFSSTMRNDLMHFYADMGMRTSNVSYSIEGGTPLCTSILGVKYIFNNNEEDLGEAYTLDSRIYAGKKVYLYENDYCLPAGYMVPSDFTDRYTIERNGNPFVNQNNFAKEVLQDDSDLFTNLYPELAEEAPFLDEQFSLVAGGGTTETFNQSDYQGTPTAIEVPAGEHAFIYVKTRIDEVSIVWKNPYAEENTDPWVKENDDGLVFKRILNLGTEDYDRTVYVYSADSSIDELTVYGYAIDYNVLSRVYDVLNSESMYETKAGERSFTGKINTEEGGMLLTSIPYDDGFEAFVDGEKTEISKVNEAFIGISLESGEHDIEFYYTPPGFEKGLLISLAGIILSILVCLPELIKYSKKQKINLENA